MPLNLDLGRAAGKLITGKVEGYALDAAMEKALASGLVCGITMFKDNARDLNQLFDLIAQARAAAGEGFFVAVDQEGGAVQRFDEVLTPLPSAMALSSLNHTGRAADVMNVAARQLNLLGVNCNLAPVLDVNSNPLNPIIGTRSFGDDPQQIARMALAVVKAHKANHILPVGKHFPGHGDTSEDSHLKLAVDRADEETLEKREFKPFAACAYDLPAMLVGHVWLPALEEEPLPASLSHKVTSEVLRGQLKFNGYVFTDDMPVMKAIVDNWGLEEACIMAINARADNVLVSGTMDQMQSVHRALVMAIETSHIKEVRLQEALTRRRWALAFTESGLQYRRESRELLIDLVSETRHAMLQTSAAAIQLMRGNLPQFNQGGKEWLIIAPDHPRYKLDLHRYFTAGRPSGAPEIKQLRYSVDPKASEIEEIAEAAAEKNVIFLTFRALLNKGQQQLAEGLVQVTAERVLVASDVPYEVAVLSGWPVALATFDPSDLAMEALSMVLKEQVTARGRCPVKLDATLQ